MGLLKVFRDGPVHTVREITVSVLVGGDFDRAYLEGDNSTTVPTDTIKNVVYALALDHFGPDGIEPFGLYLARYFLDKYLSFQEVTVDLEEKSWSRIAIDGAPHPHVFQGASDGLQTATIHAVRGQPTEVTSGLQDLSILKSADSGFEGFPRCEWTTLSEVKDRILATRLRANWHYSTPPADYHRVHADVRQAFMEVFAGGYSRAVQETLFQMATRALERVPEIDDISLRLPNLHYFTYDLARFGLENPNIIFYPAPNPHGDISATVTR